MVPYVPPPPRIFGGGFFLLSPRAPSLICGALILFWGDDSGRKALNLELNEINCASNPHWLHAVAGRRRINNKMKKGTKVGWILKSGKAGGNGTVVTDEVDGEVLVKAESQWEIDQITGRKPVRQNEIHYVLSCPVAWLTVTD